MFVMVDVTSANTCAYIYIYKHKQLCNVIVQVGVTQFDKLREKGEAVPYRQLWTSRYWQWL